VTLEGLIGELLALSHAYPAETPITVQVPDFRFNVTHIAAESRVTGVEIVIEVG
jgi:hypothetical protein